MGVLYVGPYHTIPSCMLAYKHVGNPPTGSLGSGSTKNLVSPITKKEVSGVIHTTNKKKMRGKNSRIKLRKKYLPHL